MNEEEYDALDGLLTKSLASLLLAMTFIVSCSSDEGDDNGLYLVNDSKYYNGDGDIELVLANFKIEKDVYFVQPAGKIQEGQVILNLPEEIDGKYLDKFPLYCETEFFLYDSFSCDSKVLLPEKDIFTISTYGLSATIPGKGKCVLEPRKMQGFHSAPMYFSEPGEIKGSETGVHSRGYSETITYDLTFTKGWSMVHTLLEYESSLLGYYDYVGDISHERIVLTTNSNVNYGKKLKWQAQCE